MSDTILGFAPPKSSLFPAALYAHLPTLPGLAPDEEDRLIQRLLAREESAVRVLYERYAPALLRAIRRVVDEEEVAQDILQEGLLRSWLHIARYDPARSRLSTWMQRICCYHAIDVLRSSRHHRQRRAHSLAAARRRPPASTTST